MPIGSSSLGALLLKKTLAVPRESGANIALREEWGSTLATNCEDGG